MEVPTLILIVRFSSMGDIVLTTPVIRALKEQLHGPVELHFITKKAFAPILEANPHVDQVITIDDKVKEVEERIRDTPYDYVIDLHNNLRSRQVKKLTPALSFTLSKRNVAKWLYVQTKREILPIGHIVERSMATVSPMLIEDDLNGLDMFIPTHEEVDLKGFPDAFQDGFVAYAIGGTFQGKVLPLDKMISLCEMVDSPIVLVGGPDDLKSAEAIQAAHPQHVHNACGQYSILQSASIVKQARCVIAHDTGMMHIAAALGKKVISLWFATTPEIGMSPWRPGRGSVMVEADCKKRPTSKLGNRGYQDGCVFNIDLNMVAKLVNG